jgi:hypothetical protein
MAKHNELWKGRKLLQAGDGETLENAAAVKEFRDGLPREHAEERAYGEYRAGHHEDARAHHFAGMKAALAVGDHEAARKHGQMYDLHTIAAGKDPMAGADAEVMSRMEANKAKHYRFRAHKGDGFLVHDHQEAVEKAEQGLASPPAQWTGTVDPDRVAAASRPFQKHPQKPADSDGTGNFDSGVGSYGQGTTGVD